MRDTCVGPSACVRAERPEGAHLSVCMCVLTGTEGPVFRQQSQQGPAEAGAVAGHPRRDSGAHLQHGRGAGSRAPGAPSLPHPYPLSVSIGPLGEETLLFFYNIFHLQLFTS